MLPELVEAGLQRKGEGNKADLPRKEETRAIDSRERAWGSACQLPVPSPSEVQWLYLLWRHPCVLS